MSLKKYVLAAIAVLLAAPFVSAETATTSVSVLNVESVPLRYWVDNLGPVEYDTIIGEFLSMYPKGCKTCAPVPYWDSNDPKYYVIRIDHPDSKYRDVPVRLEIYDANGYDDVTEVTVSELVNIKDNKNSLIAPFPLYLKSTTGVASATYGNTFRLYKDASHGTWRIKFSIRDSGGVHYTKYGYFYLEENAEDTKKTSSILQNLLTYLGILK